MEQKALFEALLEKISKDIQILPDKSEENALNTLCALWLTAADRRVSPILAVKQNLPVLTSSEQKTLNELILSRLSGVPLAHLTERQYFSGLDFIVNKGLYIPRKETELLAKTAIITIENYNIKTTELNVIDLCTGIGTLALAIAYNCENTKVFGSDIFEPAIDAAKINAKHFGLETVSSFHYGNMFEPFEIMNLKDKTDLIVSAPPYISSQKVKQMPSEIAEHEPPEAFDAGPFGLSIFNQIISISPEYLKIDGYLIFECGLGQGDFLAKRISDNKNFGEIEKICDEQGNVRVLKARKVDVNV